MTSSMTGYASNEREFAGQLFVWELRSVNHRYLDMALKLPDGFRFIEPEVRRMISTHIKRGRIDCGLFCKKTALDTSALTLNHEQLKLLLDTLKNIETSYPRDWQAIDLMAVMNWPGVLQQTRIEYEDMAGEILRLLEETLLQATKTRQDEGRQLAALIRERCHSMTVLVETTRQRLPLVLLEMRQKISQRLAEISANPDMERLEQEMVYLAQRLDVSEELDRIDTHLGEILKVLVQTEPAGRRLDFLVQELNREANTLGSKSQDGETTRAAVEMKVLIEQLREQAQNLE